MEVLWIAVGSFFFLKKGKSKTKWVLDLSIFAGTNVMVMDTAVEDLCTVRKAFSPLVSALSILSFSL